MELSEYLRNPCGQSYITIPPHITILHHRDFTPEAATGCKNQLYFRLIHDLRSIPDCNQSEFRLEPTSPEQGELITAIVNQSYPDIRITKDMVQAMQNSSAYCPELWILAREEETGAAVGCAMGEFDPQSGEMSIEWVQVLPPFRRRGIGKILVSELLRRTPEGTRFVTVSGQVANDSNPEALYRCCGFTGNDYWHILSKEI